MRPQCGSWLTVKSIRNLQPLFPSPTPPVLPLKNVERKQHSLAYLEGNKDLKGCDDSCKESHWILVKSYPVNQQEGNWWGHHGGRRWWLGGSVVMQRDFELCFHHMKMMEQGGFFFSFSFLWSVSSASCSLRALNYLLLFPLAPLGRHYFTVSPLLKQLCPRTTGLGLNPS